jgi:iron complex outermembrane receptor protein
VENRSLAGYGQLTYSITEKLSFTAGLRRTVERRRVQKWISYDTAGLAGAVPGLAGDRRFFFDRSERFGNWSPLANLAYRLSDAALVYARFSRGFKGGGFNGRAMSSTDPLSTQKIDDEKLTSYEMGLKSQWLDKRLTLNVTGFHSIYEDIQLTVVGADRVTQQIQTFVVNAGTAEIDGAEIELRARSDFGLDFGTSLGITHARYTEFDPIDPAASSNGDPEDNRLPNTPTYTLHFGVGYTWPVGRASTLRLHADWTHIGSSGTDAADSRILRKGKHGELDATLTWMLSNGKTELVVFGNNLLNREYVANGIDFADSFGHATRFYAAPRTYGLELRRQF